MSSPSCEWTWEPRVPIHPSHLEMTPLRIPSPAPDSPEYSSQGSEESSFSGDESCPAREFGEDNALCVAENRLVQVFDQRLKEGRLWDVNMKPSLSSLQWAGIVSGSHDLDYPDLELSSSSFLSIGGEDPARLHDPDDDDVCSEEAGLRTPPLQDLTGIPSLDETGSKTSTSLWSLYSRGREEGERGWRKGSSDSPGRARASARDSEDRDQRIFRDAEDRPPKPPSAELTRGKGVASEYPRESQKRRLPTGPIDFQDPVGGRESAVPLGGSTCGSSSSMTPTSYAKERFNPRYAACLILMMDSFAVNLMLWLLRKQWPTLALLTRGHTAMKQRVGWQSGWIETLIGTWCRYDASIPIRAFLFWLLILPSFQSLTIAGQLISVSQEAIADRDAAGKKVKAMEEEIVGLRSLHTELTSKHNECRDYVRRLEGSLKKERNQSTSRLTELESARSKCKELEGKIERLERRIAELEQQHPSSMGEMIERWQTSEEGMAAISELARPATKAGYSMTFQHFGSYLFEVPADKKWDGLPWPHDDIGVTDQNVPYYIIDGPPPPVIIDAEEEGEPGEVIIADS
ncbi:hypothetical protein Dimus_013337 [Dionaea muscipula]